MEWSLFLLYIHVHVLLSNCLYTLMCCIQVYYCYLLATTFVRFLMLLLHFVILYFVVCSGINIHCFSNCESLYPKLLLTVKSTNTTEWCTPPKEDYREKCQNSAFPFVYPLLVGQYIQNPFGCPCMLLGRPNVILMCMTYLHLHNSF